MSESRRPEKESIDVEIDAALKAQSAWIDKIVRSASRYKILSTLPYSKVDFWNRSITTMHPRATLLSRLAARFAIDDPGMIFRLLRAAPKYQLIFISGGERRDLIYAALAGLCPWIRTPHIVVSAHWQKEAGIAGWIQSTLLRLSNRIVMEWQPHSIEEVDLYASQFGIPASKIRPVPWSTSLLGYKIKPETNKKTQLLSGGISYRDYKPLIQAAGELKFTLQLGIPPAGVTSDLKAEVKRWPSVGLRTDWDNQQYLERQAASEIFALPITPGLTRSTGDQTILNAMQLSTIIVATDTIGTRLYIKDGINGFLVKEPSVAEWKKVLKRVLALDEQAKQKIVRQAKFDAQVTYNEYVRLARTIDNGLQYVDMRHRTSWHVRSAFSTPGESRPDPLERNTGFMNWPDTQAL